jgi:Rps23 Pro-64 3,4-dihydroxylase Tpa1-like proline 4-hydroxylase
MTSKHLLDAFSETLVQDERILSSRERELLANLLQNAKEAAIENQTLQDAVTATIARSVGETVAQRAFALLGSNIVEQIGARIAGSSNPEGGVRHAIYAGPQPPNAPQPFQPADDPDTPKPVTPPGPQPPNVNLRSTGSRRDAVQSVEVASTNIGILDKPEVRQAQCVILDEFLAPQEVEELIAYTLTREAAFRTSEIISPSGKPGVTDYSHRRSRVLLDLDRYEELILSRIERVLPRVREQLGVEDFPITRTEMQITASNDGDFFRPHCDDGQETIAGRRLTFVYFFHREPAQFDGGELRLHDSLHADANFSMGSYEMIVPQQNQIVFFLCSTLHEITPVLCRSRAFADSRFTVNGWLHR